MLIRAAVFFGASFLMLSMGQAQVSPSSFEKRCQDILNGPQRTHLKNEILKQKNLLYASDFVSTYCPNLKNMKSDDEKSEAVVRLMAAYSYAEVNCNPNFKSPQLRKGQLPRLGGYYNLPLDYKDRKVAPLAGTPCDVLELTPGNQAACAIYLALIPENSKKLEYYGISTKVHKIGGLKRVIAKSARLLAPTCREEIVVNKAAPSSTDNSGGASRTGTGAR